MAGRRTNVAQQRKGPDVQQGEFGPWSITTVKSHILESDGDQKDRFDKELELPQLPEMVFGGNKLQLTHSSGFGLEFNALDALKLVDASNDPLKVAASKVWREARADCAHIQNVVKPFDWTYTTDYRGTLTGEPALKIIDTKERIDMDKLKQRERICFYDDVVLFEDELSDNGCSILSVKIRVMPTCFFILLRFFMRVDDVLVRISDTRIYYESSWNYMLREYTMRDENTKNLKVPSHVLTDPNEIAKHLVLRVELYEKLEFPVAVAQPTLACTEQGILR